jgi:hypothetical protein
MGHEAEPEKLAAGRRELRRMISAEVPVKGLHEGRPWFLQSSAGNLVCFTGDSKGSARKQHFIRRGFAHDFSFN